MKVRRQRKRILYIKNAEGLTEEDFVVKTSQQVSTHPFKTLIPIESNTFSDGSDSSDADVDEEDAAQLAQEESFDMTREEAKIESATVLLFTIVTIILLIF